MTHSAEFKRRDLLAGGMALTASAILPSGLSFAATPSDKRLVIILLRGGMDGLSLFPPFGDKDYQSTRGKLAMEAPNRDDGIIDLDGMFGLHPSAASLIPFWQRGELAIIPATATPYRGRSHFDAQEVLENGTDQPGGAYDGWLNRALKVMGGTGTPAISVSKQVPFILQGGAKTTAWSPNELPDPVLGFYEKLRLLYKEDTLLGPMLADGLRNKKVMESTLSKDDLNSAKSARKVQDLDVMAKLAGRYLTHKDGPRVAVLEASGWDTHVQQGLETGRLARKFASLSAGLDALHEEMSPVWDKTVIVAISEFGRTVSPNGSSGTDHGTAGAALLLGGAVIGGKITGAWPGLSKNNLYEGRDLKPTVDTRAIFKRVLQDHMKISPRDINNIIFPRSNAAKPLKGLIR